MLLGLNPSPAYLQEVFPSDASLFIQGLEKMDDYHLLVGTGLYGESKIGVLDLRNGSFKSHDQLDTKYFGEGITRTPYGIWQLTWKNGKAFLRDCQTFEVIDEKNYDSEGWGIAYDVKRDCLWMSDGTSRIYQRNAETFELMDSFEVYDGDGKPITKLNELECVDDNIYANIWYTNTIAVINVETENLIKAYDVTELIDDLDLSVEERQKMDVLNGIAHKEDNHFYITGKYFPNILEVTLN